MKISLIYGTDAIVLPGKAAGYIDKASKKDIKAFYQYIYKDATIYLIRKKENFEHLSFIEKI